MSVNSNLSRWDFFYRTLCMLHDTRRKAEHSVARFFLREEDVCTQAKHSVTL